MHLRPLGIGELLDAAIKLCIAHRGTLVRVVLFVVVPVQILSVLVQASTLPDDVTSNPFSFDNSAQGSLEGDDAAAFFAGQVVVALLAGVTFLFAAGACFRAVTEAWLGGTPEWRESLRFAVRRAPALLWVSILYLLALVLGFLLLVIPGVWASVAFALAWPVVFVERLGGFRAMRRSAGLIRGRWWATFGAFLIAFLLATVLSSIAQGIFALLTVVSIDESSVLALALNGLGAAIGSVIATPLQAAIVALAYFDLRVRKEGLDLALVAERIGAHAPAGAAGAAGVPGAPAAPAAGDTAAEAFGTPAPPAAWEPPAGWEPPRPAPPGSSSG